MKVMLVDSPNDPVRLAFCHLFEKRAGMQNDDGTKGKDKFEVTPIFKPDGENAKKVQAAIAAVAAEKYGTDLVDELDADGEKTGRKVPQWQAIYRGFADSQKGLRKGNLKRDGSEQIYSGFEGMSYVVARNEVRPGLFDRDTTPLAESDGRPYSGCHGNVEIDVWALNKPKVTKRIVTDLCGVQFTRDGDAFGSGSTPSKASSFSNLSAADEDAGPTNLGAGSAFD